MSDTRTSGDDDRTLYWLIAVFVGVLMIAAAHHLLQREVRPGGPAEGRSSSRRSSRRPDCPCPRTSTSSRGPSASDGGAVCDNPASALGKATLADQIANGASFVGRRPVIIDRDLLVGRAADPADVLP